MFSRGVRQAILRANDPTLPFHKIAPLLRGADIAFLNLETPFSDQGPYHAGGLIFHAAPEMITGLELANIALVSTANNHARDCFGYGVEFTVQWLRSHGIAPLGSGLTSEDAHAGVVLERHGIRFGFLGYTFDQRNGNWPDDDPRIAVATGSEMADDVRSMRQKCDILVVSMHHGIEYQPRPSAAQTAFAHQAIDAGADLVIGHHPHVVQPRELYRGKPIYYSLGNFIFDQFQREATQHGLLVEISFLGTQILAERSLPVRITNTGPELDLNSPAPAVLNVTRLASGGQLHMAAKFGTHR